MRSFASYGTTPMRRRADLYAYRKQQSEDGNSADHPCYFKGYRAKLGTVDPAAGADAVFDGKGDAAGCREIIDAILAQARKERPCKQPPCSLDGIHQPPLRAQFVAMTQLTSIVEFMRSVLPPTSPGAQQLQQTWPSP